MADYDIHYLVKESNNISLISPTFVLEGNVNVNTSSVNIIGYKNDNELTYSSLSELTAPIRTGYQNQENQTTYTYTNVQVAQQIGGGLTYKIAKEVQAENVDYIIIDFSTTNSTYNQQSSITTADTTLQHPEYEEYQYGDSQWQRLDCPQNRPSWIKIYKNFSNKIANLSEDDLIYSAWDINIQLEDLPLLYIPIKDKNSINNNKDIYIHIFSGQTYMSGVEISHAPATSYGNNYNFKDWRVINYFPICMPQIKLAASLKKSKELNLLQRNFLFYIGGSSQAQDVFTDLFYQLYMPNYIADLHNNIDTLFEQVLNLNIWTLRPTPTPQTYPQNEGINGIHDFNLNSGEDKYIVKNLIYKYQNNDFTGKNLFNSTYYNSSFNKKDFYIKIPTNEQIEEEQTFIFSGMIYFPSKYIQDYYSYDDNNIRINPPQNYVLKSIISITCYAYSEEPSNKSILTIPSYVRQIIEKQITVKWQFEQEETTNEIKILSEPKTSIFNNLDYTYPENINLAYRSFKTMFTFDNDVKYIYIKATVQNANPKNIYIDGENKPFGMFQNLTQLMLEKVPNNTDLNSYSIKYEPYMHSNTDTIIDIPQLEIPPWLI